MAFEKGQTANRRGRPPKERALTAILEAELGKTVDLADGRRVAAKRQVAALVAQFLATGQVVFPDGRVMSAKSVDEYFNVVRWMYRHVDGEKSHIDITSLGDSIVSRVEVITPADEPTPDS